MGKVIIYTDGSCLGNPGKGGRASIIMFINNGKIVKKKIISGFDKNTTNNKMELTAVIKSLEKLNNSGYLIEIWTDSKYVMDGITKRIKKWEKNNRKTSDGNDVKNKDLWLKLFSLVKNYNISWNYVKAHNINEFNNLVDSLARKSAKEQK